MPITYPVAPARGVDVVRRNLQEILGSPAGAGVLKGHQAGEASLAAPHRSYFVRLDDLAKGRMLAAAQPVAWRYLIYVADQAVAEAELSQEDSPAEPTFLAFHEGPFADASARALLVASALPKVKKSNYEVRYLKIPSVYFAAIWLHNDQDDSVIPLHNPPAELKENRPYTEAQIVGALADVARQMQAFNRKSSRRKPK